MNNKLYISWGIKMGEIRFVLDKTLREIGITPHKLSLESKIRSNTIYSMIHNETKRIEIETLISLLDTLNSLANKKISVSDIFIYIQSK